MEKIKTTSSLCMRCLQSVMTEEIKEDNNYEFFFVEGVCQNCEDETQVTSCYYEGKEQDKEKVSKYSKLGMHYLTMRKAYQWCDKVNN